MPLRFFNIDSRQLEQFTPRPAAAERKIDIYTCGPIVYSRALAMVMVSGANHLTIAALISWQEKARNSVVRSLASLGMTPL